MFIARWKLFAYGLLLGDYSELIVLRKLLFCFLLKLSLFFIRLFFTRTCFICVGFPKVRPFLLNKVSLESDTNTLGTESENYRFRRLVSYLLSSSESKLTELFISLNITEEFMPNGLAFFRVNFESYKVDPLACLYLRLDWWPSDYCGFKLRKICDTPLFSCFERNSSLKILGN